MDNRAIDYEVAEKVMGWSKAPKGKDYTWMTSPEGAIGIPRYSTDISAAWMVVEKMREKGLWPTVCAGQYGNGWIANFGDWPGALAMSAPEAICLAALKALARGEQ